MTLENILKVNIVRAHYINMYEMQLKLYVRGNLSIKCLFNLQNYHLGFQWKMIEKQAKPNIKLKEVNNKMLHWWNTKKAIGVAMKYKVNFAKMVNKIEIFLGRLIKGKKEKNRLYR